jgi:hypothetical protein
MGFVDKSGNLVIAAQFDYAFKFSKVSPVESGYFIDSTGKFVIEPQFTSSFVCSNMAFSGGLSAVDLKDKCLFVNKSGDVEIQTEFDPQDTGRHIRHFSQGLVPVQIDDKWGYMDETGRLAIPAQFSEAGHFSFPDRPFLLRDF